LLLLGLVCAAACASEKPRILSVTIPGDTRDTLGPYVVQVVVRGLASGDLVQVRYSIDNGLHFYKSEAQRVSGRSDLYDGAIPGQPQGTTVEYYVAVERGGKVVAFDPMAGDANGDGGPHDAGPAPMCPPDAAPHVVIDSGHAPALDGGAIPPIPPPLDAGPADAGVKIDAAPPIAGCGDFPPVAFLYSFRVLPISGACVVDSECRIGLEICDDGTCRAYSGTCLLGGGADICPDGYVCDMTHTPATCVIAPRVCSDDRQCPSVEQCDTTLMECRARPVCSDTITCPAPEVCNLSVGLCYHQ
jgi:hypothetical protein